MLPLEHSHTSNLAHGLPHLSVLDLSGCKKLQPRVTKLLQQPGALQKLQCLNLQRCFQLNDLCLTDLLARSCRLVASQNEDSCSSASAAAASSALQCIALSHLNLAAWPPAAHSNSTTSSTASTVAVGGFAEGNSCSATAAFWQQVQDVVRAALLHLPSGLDVAALLPHGGASSAVPRTVSNSSSSLRVVVLNNCSQLSIEGLLTIAIACPQLELLMLGGSTLKASWDSGPAAGSAAAAGGGGSTAEPGDQEGAAAGAAAGAYVPPRVAAAAGHGSGTVYGVCAGQERLPAALQQLAALLELPPVLPWEALSACCTQQDGMGCQQRACTCCCSEEGGSGSRAGTGSSSKRAQARSQLQKNEPSAAALAAARSHALTLAYAAALLPQLKVLEVTFMAPGVAAGWLRACMRRMQLLRARSSRSFGSSIAGSGVQALYRSCSTDSSGSGTASCSSGGSCMSCCGGDDCCPLYSIQCVDGSDSSSTRSCPTVWDFTCIASVQQALQMVQDCRRSYQTAGKAGTGAGAALANDGGSRSSVLNPACLETALRCAANCSWSRGRSTPLHLAAERGCAQHISALVRGGAAVAARDSSGASPLFVAAEAGNAAAVSVLLQAGADPLVGNTAGETALYIASLRGHLPVVEVLLSHLSAAKVDWMQEGLYGDAWTPLMAAAVANRVDVALCLLQAATGFSKAGVEQQQQSAGAGVAGGSGSSAIRYQNHAYAYRKQGRCSLDKGSSDRDSSSEGAGVERLLAAENRYGQTALHIAARKGCRELLRLLLLYGAVQVAGQVVDASGDTWTDVARRHGHDVALRELLQQC